MIEERSIAVAVCDACGHKDYGDEKGDFYGGDGFTLTIDEHRTDNQHNAYACRETHIGKAARAVLDRWRNDENQPWHAAGGSSMPPDAPPLPEHNGDATAVTP